MRQIGHKTSHVASFSKSRVSAPFFMELFLFFVFMAIAGCGGKQEPAKLKYMMWGDVNEIESVRKSLGEFQKAFPRLQAEIVHARGSDEYRRKLQTMTAGRTPPDVMYVEATDFPGYHERNMFLDMSPYASRDRDFPSGDYYPRLLELFKVDGRLYGIPKDFATLILYYNASLFDHIGLEYPGRSWDWDTMAEAARRLTADADNDGRMERFGVDVNPHVSRWAAFLRQNGGGIVDETSSGWAIGDRLLEENAAAFSFLNGLIYELKVSPTPSIMREEMLFETGRLGMTLAGRWMCLRYKAIKDFAWDMAEVPKGRKRASVLFTVCYAISKDTKHADGAWKLAAFMAGKHGQVETAVSGHAVPSLASIAESGHFLNAKELPPGLDHAASIRALAYARTLPLHHSWLMAQDILQRNIDRIFVDESADISRVLKDTQKELEAAMR